MAKILFDIAVAHEPADWLNCHLVMEVSPHIFSYAILNREKKLLQLRFYELYARNNHELAQELGEVITADSTLKTGIEKKTFIYNFPESQLVPEKYFNADAGRDLIELIHGDLNKGITLSERIQGSPQYNVFRVPAEVHSLLQRNFANSKYWHYYSLWMQYRQKQTGDRAAYLSVMFYPNHLLVAAVKDKQLHLLQSYAYETAEDAGYYLLNICGQLQLSPEEIPVLLSGMIDVSSALYTEIFKYFGQVELEGFPDTNMEPALQDYPAHFFSSLLKLAICVS
ncbi:MAG: DUF3822 family protein [Chitinophagaceae bacterium]